MTPCNGLLSAHYQIEGLIQISAHGYGSQKGG
jgi:hypothetical protein